MEDIFIVLGVIFCVAALSYIIVISTAIWLEAELIDKEIEQAREGL